MKLDIQMFASAGIGINVEKEYTYEYEKISSVKVIVTPYNAGTDYNFETDMTCSINETGWSKVGKNGAYYKVYTKNTNKSLEFTYSNSTNSYTETVDINIDEIYPFCDLTLVVDKQPKSSPSNEKKEYKLRLLEPLRSFNNSFDKLLISSSGKVSVTRNIERIDDNLVVKSNSTIENYNDIKITFFQGDNYVYLKENPQYQLKIKYLTNNEMNKHYALNEAVNSKFEQTEKSFLFELSKKVNGEDFTHAEIVARINDDTSELKINFDKVDIEANDVLNILAGNEINMTTKNISITAENASIDKNGNAKFKNADIEGKITSSEGVIGGWKINNNGLTNETVFINNDGSSTVYTVADLIIIRGYILKTPGFEMSSAMIEHYDLNNDGVVDAKDYVLLQNLIGITMN